MKTYSDPEQGTAVIDSKSSNNHISIIERGNNSYIIHLERIFRVIQPASKKVLKRVRTCLDIDLNLNGTSIESALYYLKDSYCTLSWVTKNIRNR
jgi:hypothetical protein